MIRVWYNAKQVGAPTASASEAERSPEPRLSAIVRVLVRDWAMYAGLSQNEFARQIGVSQASMSQLLSGSRHRRDLDLWQTIARQFDHSLSELIAEAEARQQAIYRQDAR